MTSSTTTTTSDDERQAGGSKLELVTLETPSPCVRIVYDFVSAHEEAYLLSVRPVRSRRCCVSSELTTAAEDRRRRWEARGHGQASCGLDDSQRTAVSASLLLTRASLRQLTRRCGISRSMYWGGSITPKGSLVPASNMPAFMSDSHPRILDRISQLVSFAHAGTADGEEEGQREGVRQEGGKESRLANHVSLELLLLTPACAQWESSPLTACRSASSTTTPPMDSSCHTLVRQASICLLSLRGACES